ncbi:urea active transporter 1 [Ceratobasidium sp. AG-Ba]|nr:urea active transporter 1 [Ceratobasidium sp. AG-Ba]QRW08337.1 urea active transporter 1 [Ceratobasidium sp. AG-Ba]
MPQPTWVYAGGLLALLAAVAQVSLRGAGIKYKPAPLNYDNCASIPELKACEKISILPSGLMYLACAGTIESRITWMPTLDALNATAVRSRAIGDYVATYDIDTGKITKLDTVGLVEPRGLNVHGMDVVPDQGDPNKLWIYIVNHRPPVDLLVDAHSGGANSVIEIFTTTLGTGHMNWVRTVEDPKVVVTPNDVVGGTNGEEFWFTNDNGHKIGILRALAAKLSLKDTFVGYCHIRSGCKVASVMLQASNGIVRAADGSILVGNYRFGKLTVHKQRDDNTLQLVDEIDTGLPLDNLALSADRSIIAAAFPNPHLIHPVSRNASLTAPSAVLRISRADDGQYAVEKMRGNLDLLPLQQLYIKTNFSFMPNLPEESARMSETASTVLPQGAGYGVVVGIGLFFSAFMLCLTWIQARYTGFSPSNSEEFSSASRSVKPGLIASGIVSAWTWAATLLQSSAVAYKYGISGPWWYGAGATIQVLLFAMLAAKLKLNSPNAHTFLEIIGARWGTGAHLIFLFFGLATNIIVSSMLILGGSATVTDLTGMNTIAACFLIPIGVAIYVVAGGMRATLLCDYTHTAVLFAIILTFIFTAYATSPKIGSPSRMHELLEQAAAQRPVPGNAHGSYLTMRSKNGLIFGVINIIGNFATVFNDQAYWQRAIASKPQSCVKAYLLGGLAWFSIPFTFATTLGLAAVALYGDPGMRSLSPADVSAGLPAPSAAAALLGTSGAAAMLILLFLAVTSATSAELIAVSSLLTYDVYKRYINPRATEAQIMRVSHLMVAFFAICMGLFGLIFYYIGVSMGWLYTFMGTLLGSAVVPIALCITWQKASKIGCMVGAISGLFAGIIAWLVTTSCLNDKEINVVTSGGDYEMLAGNLAAIGVGGIVSTIWSYISPDNDFSFDVTRAINAPHHAHGAPTAGSGTQTPNEDEKKHSDSASVVPAEDDANHEKGVTQDEDLDPVALNAAFRFAAWSSIGLLIVMIILIPFPLFFSQVVFGTKGLATWVAVGIIWTFLAAFAVVLYPLWESREALLLVCKGVVKDIFHPGTGKYVEREGAREGAA